MKKLFPAIFLLFLAGGGLVRAQTFNLQTGREPLTSLDGLWRFHTGDNANWASPSFDDSKWPLLRSDKPWTEQGYRGYGGYAWYRFTIQAPAGDQPISLLLSSIATSYQIYADGRRIGGFGSMPSRHLDLLSRPEAYDLPRTGGVGPHTFHIAIRVWRFAAGSADEPGWTASPKNMAGNSSLIHQRIRMLAAAHTSTVVDVSMYAVVSLLFGLLVLGLFLFRPADREYLWFAVLLIAAFAGSACGIGVSLSAVPVQIGEIVFSCILAIFQLMALLFFSKVLGVPRTFWWRFAAVAGLLYSLTAFFYIFHWTPEPVSNALGVVLLLPSELWILAVLVRGAARKDADARLLLVPTLLDFGFVSLDNVTGIAYQLGWQSRISSLNVLVMHHPFDLRLSEVLFIGFEFGIMLFLIRRFALARREEERLSGEMNAARNVQSLLVPSAPLNTPGFSVESVYIPASEVGGDFFQILPGEDGSLLVVVGDVSGKGLKAAMTVSTIIGALRNEPSRQPVGILAHLNRVLHGQIKGFVTCCAVLIAADGNLTIANAGHLSPYRNGGELAVPSALPLGIVEDIAYEETCFQLAPGDQLIFLSDGVIEARNAKGELYGFERTQQISGLSAAAIAETARQFGQEDDITVVSTQFIAAEAGSHRREPEIDLNAAGAVSPLRWKNK